MRPHRRDLDAVIDRLRLLLLSGQPRPAMRARLRPQRHRLVRLRMQLAPLAGAPFALLASPPFLVALLALGGRQRRIVRCLGRLAQARPAVDTEVGTGHLPSLWAIRFVTPNPSLCDLNIGLAMDWERVQSLFPAHLALHAGMILFHPDADGPDWPHRQVTVACRHPTPDVENMRPCCVPEGCGSALDGKRRGTPARAQALLRRAEVAVCREDPARYPERSF